ncbi:EAL and HDOD domain-containing protein [Motilimonas pumila]|uniref:EAL domain-containing protein n=1 Tax=Motilimonas pumila TaxID=2303987 RepID=A0A418YGB5_9GAMM|nr:EAL domain-containing protein [Motilimonas pumila]RJG48671.1 EAL domain-containing protein [Motilimonas pumila]
MYSFVARQPILNQHQNLVAYELLFRDSAENVFPQIDSEYATKKLVSDTFLNLGLNKIANDKVCFINFTETAILQSLPLLLPKEHVVIELLEDIKPSDELLAQVKMLAQRGYKLALDDFEYNDAWERFFPYIKLIKFDLRLSSMASIKAVMDRCRPHKMKYLAEKVETHEEFQQAKALGFDFYQGYFFSKPEMLQQKELSHSQINIMELLAEVNKAELNFSRIDNIFSRDVSLSYKLLMFVNKLVKSNAKSITSFRQAAVYLGEEQLKKFVSLIATTQTDLDKPSELYLMSVARGRFCENLAALHKTNILPSNAFLAGLFSLLDSLLDQPLESLLENIPIDDEIVAALLQQQGPLAQYIAAIGYFEKGQWQDISEIAAALGLTTEKMSKCYLEALSWANSFTESTSQ